VQFILQAAQQRKEDRKRAEKEKLMAESDPEKARKIEVLVGVGVWQSTYIPVIVWFLSYRNVHTRRQ